MIKLKTCSKIILLIFFITGVITFLGCSKKEKQTDLIPFKISYNRNIDDLPLFVGMEKGYFKEEGLKIEQVKFDKTSNAIAGMFKGDIQACQVSFYDVVFAVQKNLPVKAVTWFGRAHKGTRCGFHIKKDNDMKSIKDLKGKKIALGNSISTRIITFTMLKQAGLTSDDVKLVLGLELDEPMKHEAALKSGRVDVITA